MYISCGESSVNYTKHTDLRRRRDILILLTLLLVAIGVNGMSSGLSDKSLDEQLTIEQDPITLLLDNKLAKFEGKSVQSLFLVPAGATNPVILVNSSQREPGAAFVKWGLSQQDSDLINSLLNQGKTIRVIPADQIAVGKIGSASPEGIAIFNKKDLRGNQIKTRESI